MAEPGDYKINYEPLFGPLQLIDVGKAIKRADHPWYNQTLIEVGGVLLRLGVFAGGEYHWHKHQEQDEFFYVIDGRLRIELEGRDAVELAGIEGEGQVEGPGLEDCGTAVREGQVGHVPGNRSLGISAVDHECPGPDRSTVERSRDGVFGVLPAAPGFRVGRGSQPGLAFDPEVDLRCTPRFLSMAIRFSPLVAT